MIIALVNQIGIKRTLVDNGSTLNVCSVILLEKIDMDKSGILPDSVYPCV